jgi:hypothetical protein
MTDPSKPTRESQSDSGYHEFSQAASHTDDSVQTGTFALRPPSQAEPIAAAPSADPPRAFGRYQVQGFLAKGSFGAVYLAEDNQLRRKVAVKVPHRHLTGNQADLFLQEARRHIRIDASGARRRAAAAASDQAEYFS